MTTTTPLRAALVLVAAVFLSAGCDRGGDGGGTSTASTRTATGPGGAKPHVAYVTNGVDSFWVIAEAGAKAGGKEYNADVEVLMPSEGVAHQKRMVEDLLVRGIDGIAVSPIDAENETSLINEAAAKTNVITQDSDAPKSNRLMYIGMDNYDAGRMVGQLVKEAIPGGGKIAIFVGRLEQDNARLRRQGVIDEVMGRSHDRTRFDPPGGELKAGKFTIVATLTDQFDRARAKSNCEDMLSLHPDLACVVGLFAYNTPMCLEALRSQQKLGKVKVAAFDEQAETLQAIKDGNCQGTVVQDPFKYGVESVRVLAALARGDQTVIPANKYLDVPARQIRKDNVDAFWTDLKQKLAKAPATK